MQKSHAKIILIKYCIQKLAKKQGYKKEVLAQLYLALTIMVELIELFLPEIIISPIIVIKKHFRF